MVFRTNVFETVSSAKRFLIVPLLMGVMVSWALSQNQDVPRNKLSYNKYGDLMNDDPEYNKKSSIWMPIAGITIQNAVVWSFNRYVSNADFAVIGLNSWERNLKSDWVFDSDGFHNNFFLHPLGGAAYYNFARSEGYSFYESGLFSVLGSAMWEYFGENTLPSKDDIISTPISGIFIGEILYRLSSNVLDDRTTGKERFFRELAAGIIDLPRGVCRLVDGKAKSVTSKEVYQKEPLNITLTASMRRINNGRDFGTGIQNQTYDFRFDYGDPFEDRPRKPFDYFNVDTELSSDPGVGKRRLGKITGYGILLDRNIHYGDNEMLIGLFQHYDYWDNRTFNLGAMAFGPGVLSKLPVGDSSNLYSSLHLGLIPLAGNNTQFGPRETNNRDYNYGAGLEGKFESRLELGDRITAAFPVYYYWVHTYFGFTGDNLVGIIKPSVTFRVYNNMNLGFEHQVYYENRDSRDFPDINSVRTEQRLFLSFYLEDLRYKK